MGWKKARSLWKTRHHRLAMDNCDWLVNKNFIGPTKVRCNPVWSSSQACEFRAPTLIHSATGEVKEIMNYKNPCSVFAIWYLKMGVLDEHCCNSILFHVKDIRKSCLLTVFKTDYEIFIRRFDCEYGLNYWIVTRSCRLFGTCWSRCVLWSEGPKVFGFPNVGVIRGLVRPRISSHLGYYDPWDVPISILIYWQLKVGVNS